MSTPDPGWYPDPNEPARARWWDGTRWSGETRTEASVLADRRPPTYVEPRRVIGDNYARLALATQLMLAIAALVDVGGMLADRYMLKVADQFLDREPDIEDADTADRLLQISGSAQLLMLLLTGIVFIMWLFQSHKNHRTDPVQQKHGPGWAIGGWFVPVLNLWRPFGMTIDVRRGVEGEHAEATPVMWAWWLAFLASSVLGRAAGAFWNIDPDLGIRKYGDALRTAAQVDIAYCIVDIIAAVLAILMVRQLTRLVRDAPVIS